MRHGVRPRIKICCISSLEEARLAVRLGADALGLVSAMPSGPGVIDEDLIARIAASTPPPVATFLLTALRDAEAIAAQHARCRTTVIQLVDRLEPGESARLQHLLPGVKLVQVIHVQDEAAIEQAREAAEWADALLLDSGNPGLAVKELGGTGRVHDWSLSRRIRQQVARPLFLAGGLCDTNAARALAEVEPFGLDLCSGAREGGRLSAPRLASFMRAVRGAAGEP